MSRCEHSSNQACDDCLRATATERYETTPLEPKAPEPSDKRVRAEAVSALLCHPTSTLASAYLVGYRTGRESVAYLLAEVEALKAERDKLHAAIAWREIVGELLFDGNGALWLDRGELLQEPHDGTPAGRAAALVRLFERCGDGTNR